MLRSTVPFIYHLLAEELLPEVESYARDVDMCEMNQRIQIAKTEKNTPTFP